MTRPTIKETKDIKLSLKTFDNGDSLYDIDFKNGDFQREDGLETTILIALFADARANSSQVVNPLNRRGYIGDVLNTRKDVETGSLLWLIGQARLNQETLNRAIDYTTKALNFLIIDGILNDIQVTGEIIGNKDLNLTLAISKKAGGIEKKTISLFEKTFINN